MAGNPLKINGFVVLITDRAVRQGAGPAFHGRRAAG
jgi:hypothetical protein